jgi:hypothetical protein
MGEKVRVIYGTNDVEFDGIAEKSIASVHRALKTVFSIPAYVQAWVNGSPRPGDYLLQAGDTLVFIRTGWGLKGALTPDELERFIRRIDNGVEKLIEEGLFELRLNDTEKDIFKELFQHKTMIGEALAKHLNVQCDSNFKATLAALVRHGLLANGEGGYFIPPAVSRHLKATGAV